MNTLKDLASLRLLHPGKLKLSDFGEDSGLKMLAARTGSFGFLSYQINLEVSMLNLRYKNLFLL